MKSFEKISGVTYVADLKSREIKLGTEAQKKHEEMLALIERTKKRQKQVELVEI